MDSLIIKRIKNKEQEGMEMLINMYSKNISYIVSTILRGYGSKEDIEECMSDIFVSIWEDIDKLDESRGSFKMFILIKSKYTALTYKRKIVSESQKINMENIEECNISANFKIEEHIINKEDVVKLIKIVKEFKEPDRTYFYFRYFRGYEIDDLARKFNDAKRSIENKLYRCRVKIKEVMGKGNM